MADTIEGTSHRADTTTLGFNRTILEEVGLVAARRLVKDLVSGLNEDNVRRQKNGNVLGGNAKESDERETETRTGDISA